MANKVTLMNEMRNPSYHKNKETLCFTIIKSTWGNKFVCSSKPSCTPSNSLSNNNGSPDKKLYLQKSNLILKSPSTQILQRHDVIGSIFGEEDIEFLPLQKKKLFEH